MGEHFANDYDALKEFLAPRRYVVLTTLRRDGSPLSTPVGYYYDEEGGYIYFTMQTIRLGVKRLAKDPRVAICTVDNADGQPPSDFRVHGTAEVVSDPDHVISLKVAERAVKGRPGYDFEEFTKNWLSHGRVVYRVPVDDETTRFKDGSALVRAVAEGRARYEIDGAGTGGADGTTLYTDAERARRAAEGAASAASGD